jgi:hypothetical protein
MKRRDILLSVGTIASAASVSAASMSDSRREAPAQFTAGIDRRVMDPSYIDARLDSRAISFENPTGARGAGGTAANGRKGRPNYVISPGEKVTLADIAGAGTVRHIWMTTEDWPPEVMRALKLEAFYDGINEPSISVPILDFFALPHGRRATFESALVAVNEARGLNSYLPMPFARSLRIELTNESRRHITLYYQIDYTLGGTAATGASYLHATFRRQNPTIQRQDFVICEGLRGPGRFLGCSVGVRVIDGGHWYGEGEVKIYRDGDDLPTICGTGLEDYAGTAWGMGRFSSQYCGSPIQVPLIPPESRDSVKPTFVGFYRWHLPDPIMFASELRVTIQQIGAALFMQGQQKEFEAYKLTNPAAGHGWLTGPELDPLLAFGLAERSDDYCATAFVYCDKPQGVPRVDVAAAVRGVALLPDEPALRVTPSEDVRDAWNRGLKAYLQSK